MQTREVLGPILWGAENEYISGIVCRVPAGYKHNILPVITPFISSYCSSDWLLFSDCCCLNLIFPHAILRVKLKNLYFEISNIIFFPASFWHASVSSTYPRPSIRPSVGLNALKYGRRLKCSKMCKKA